MVDVRVFATVFLATMALWALWNEAVVVPYQTPHSYLTAGMDEVAMSRRNPFENLALSVVSFGLMCLGMWSGSNMVFSLREIVE